MLKNDRIYLRALENTDAETILTWENDPENWRVSETRVPFSKEIIQKYVANAQDIFAVRQVRLMICEITTNNAIGSVDLFDYEPLHQHAGVGILLTQANRGQGYASDALALLENYAVNAIGIRNLHCTILSNNKASRNLFTKAGYMEVGCKKNWFNNHGEWLDEYSYQKIVVK